MTAFRATINDAAHVRQETHVQHAIRFVEHEILDGIQLHQTALHVIKEPSRRGDENIHALLERVRLRAVADAAVEHGHGEIGEAAEIAHGGLNLRREFAGGFEDEHAGLGLVRAELGKDGQGEGRRLAGAGLGAANDVAALQNQRDGAQLDRRRIGVTHGDDAL